MDVLETRNAIIVCVAWLPDWFLSPSASTGITEKAVRNKLPQGSGNPAENAIQVLRTFLTADYKR